MHVTAYVRIIRHTQVVSKQAQKNCLDACKCDEMAHKVDSALRC